MLGRRRRGPSLVRTAAVVGTATAVSGNVSRRQQQRAAGQQAEAAQAAAAAAPPAAEDMSAQLAQVEQLGQLKAQGLLTDAEFEAKKKLILGL